jgi:hypothetical protein
MVVRGSGLLVYCTGKAAEEGGTYLLKQPLSSCAFTASPPGQGHCRRVISNSKHLSTLPTPGRIWPGPGRLGPRPISWISALNWRGHSMSLKSLLLPEERPLPWMLLHQLCTSHIFSFSHRRHSTFITSTRWSLSTTAYTLHNGVDDRASRTQVSTHLQRRSEAESALKLWRTRSPAQRLAVCP